MTLFPFQFPPSDGKFAIQTIRFLSKEGILPRFRLISSTEYLPNITDYNPGEEPFNSPGSNHEIMRQVIIALGFSFIVLFLIAGCTTPQHATCNLSSTDPIKFQKFLPDIPGYEREFGQNISVGNNYRKDSPGWLNGIEDHYRISGQNTQNTMSVSFYDLGPCANESTGVFSLLNNYHFGVYLDTLESRVLFHGYPAIHVIHTIFPSEFIRSDSYRIGISNRFYVVISRYSSSDKRILLSEAEADIEKFANAIDFNGLASTV